MGHGSTRAARAGGRPAPTPFAATSLKLSGLLERHYLSLADLGVIATLRRIGSSFLLAQSNLMAPLGLTSVVALFNTPPPGRLAS